MFLQLFIHRKVAEVQVLFFRVFMSLFPFQKKDHPTKNYGIWISEWFRSRDTFSSIKQKGKRLRVLKSRNGKTFWVWKYKVADLSPKHLRKRSATDGTELDLNIGVSPGFGGLIQGQIHNPEIDQTLTFWHCFFCR